VRESADPVCALLRRYRGLCERAVDPLEIAAALEAHGVTDRTAARFRHRDVFSLAEEMYARVPRVDVADAPAAGAPPFAGWRGPARGIALPLLPGALSAAALAAWGPGPLRLGSVTACALLAVATAALALAGPGPRRLIGLCVALPALGCALHGEALSGEVVRDGGPAAGAAALALALAVAPAAWCRRWFAARAGRLLAGSRELREFAARVRPLLAAACAAYATGLAAALLAGRSLTPVLTGRDPTGGEPATAAFGLLLFAAALLAAHGYGRAAATGLVTAGGVTLLALATGLAAVPVLACGGAALALLAHAARVLARASAHEPTPADPADLPHPDQEIKQGVPQR
jgi:hypothetical protein